MKVVNGLETVVSVERFVTSIATRLQSLRMPMLLAFGMLVSACTTPYEGRYDFYQGWVEAVIIRIEPFEKLSPNVVPACSAGPSSWKNVGSKWAVVRYRIGNRSRFTAVPVPLSEDVAVGETVYANVWACSPDLRKRATVG